VGQVVKRHLLRGLENVLSLGEAGQEDAKASQYSYSGAYEPHEPAAATQGQEDKISNLAGSSEEFMPVIEEIV
jgi:hypothetical protein